MKLQESGLPVERSSVEPGVVQALGNRLRTFVHDTEGAALIEYGLLVLLIAALCIVLLQTIGSKVSNGFNSANAALP